MMLGKPYVHMQKNENRSVSIAFHNNSKWIKDITQNTETLEKNIGSTLHDIRVGKDFLLRTPCAQELRPATNW